jgi:hypothetical protein
VRLTTLMGAPQRYVCCGLRATPAAKGDATEKLRGGTANGDKLCGKLDQAMGKVNEGVARASDDEELTNEGRGDQPGRAGGIAGWTR